MPPDDGKVVFGKVNSAEIGRTLTDKLEFERVASTQMGSSLTRKDMTGVTPEQQANISKALGSATISTGQQLPTQQPTKVPDADVVKPLDHRPPQTVQQIGADLHKAGVTMDK